MSAATLTGQFWQKLAEIVKTYVVYVQCSIETVSVWLGSRRMFFLVWYVKGYRKMCHTGMVVGALVNSTVDSMSLGPNCDALFFLCVLARGFGAFTNALFFALEDSVVPWKFHCQFIMGDKLAYVSSIQPNEK